MTTGPDHTPVVPDRTVSHLPAMAAETLRFLDPKPGETHVDATVGCGGHAVRILAALQPNGVLLGVDRDMTMLQAAREALGAFPRETWRLFQASYAELGEVLEAADTERVDGILLDAGFNSAQMDAAGRGFSYRGDGPLDMRYDDEGPTAADLVNGLEEDELIRIFREYGEERFARRIARRIVETRTQAPITRTGELCRLIESAVPSQRRRLHPARRVFQALRIAVNSELDHLEKFLDVAAGFLNPGGRLVVLSYHSLEDRRVKLAFRRDAEAGLLAIETRRPVFPADEETAANPRARSARLRAAVRTDAGPAGAAKQGAA